MSKNLHIHKTSGFLLTFHFSSKIIHFFGNIQCNIIHFLHMDFDNNFKFPNEIGPKQIAK